MKPRIKRKILTALFYALYTLFILEGTSRVILMIDPLFVRIMGYDDVSARFRWVKRHRETQVEILYQFDNYDPTKGWAVKPNIKDARAFENKVFNTNSKGLRGPVEYTYEKPTGKARILILGDSFTFGDEVSDHETYPYYLGELLPEAEIINMGVHGYGHDQMLIYLQEEGVKYRPDIVILGFIYDDMYRNMVSFKDYAKPKFEVVNGELVLKNSPVPRPEVILQQEFYRLKFVGLLVILYQKIQWQFGFNQAEMRVVTTAILDEMVKTIETIGARPVFIYLPDEMDERAIPGEEFLLEYCRERSAVACTSLRPAFLAHFKNREEFKAYGEHWNPQGNYLAAQALRDYLRDAVLRQKP